MPSLPNASPTHLLAITAAMRGTMYRTPPVSSNIMTTKATEIRKNARACSFRREYHAKKYNTVPVILVMPPRTAAAPTIAYSPGVMQSSPPAEHSP